MFNIWYIRFIQSYSTYFHGHVTPKLGLTLQHIYYFSKWDTIGNISEKNEDFCYGAEKGPYGPFPPFRIVTLDIWTMCEYLNQIMPKDNR